MAHQLRIDHRHLQALVSGRILPGLVTLRRLSVGLGTSLERVALACEQSRVYWEQEQEVERVLAGLPPLASVRK